MGMISERMKNRYTAFIGLLMGLAEVVPGVSGGTIAFVGGIYERFINAIKGIDSTALSFLLKGRFQEFSRKVDLLFLTFLLGGMAVGLVVGVFGISYLLDHHPVGIWSFFFGLILASSIYLGSLIPHWDVRIVFSVLVGAGVAYWITVQSPSVGQDALWAYFLSGAIAISAMILPGISGSFVLLLLGMYSLILTQAKNFLGGFEMEAFVKIIVFGVGVLVGVGLFSRVLSWLFQKYKYTTYAVLTGFVFGSLNKIWPWKRASLGQDEFGDLVDLRGSDVVPEGIRVFREENLSPFHEAVREPHLLSAIIMGILGVALILFLSKVERNKI